MTRPAETYTDRTQDLVDAAFDRWRGQLLESRDPADQDKQNFWDQLDARERTAVFFCDLINQVCNGGFEQYVINGYHTRETAGFLLRELKRIRAGSDPAAAETAEGLDELLRHAFKKIREHGRPCEAEFPREFGAELCDLDLEFGCEALDPANRHFWEIAEPVRAMLEARLLELDAARAPAAPEAPKAPKAPALALAGPAGGG